MTLKAGALIDIADFGDTGWTSIALLAGYTGTLEGCRVGNDIWLRGTVAPTTNWGAAQADNLIVSALSSNLQTPQPFAEMKAGTAITTAAIFRVAFNGAEIRVRCGAATHTSGVYVSVNYRGI